MKRDAVSTLRTKSGRVSLTDAVGWFREAGFREAEENVSTIKAAGGTPDAVDGNVAVSTVRAAN